MSISSAKTEFVYLLNCLLVELLESDVYRKGNIIRFVRVWKGIITKTKADLLKASGFAFRLFFRSLIYCSFIRRVFRIVSPKSSRELLWS